MDHVCRSRGQLPRKRVPSKISQSYHELQEIAKGWSQLSRKSKIEMGKSAVHAPASEFAEDRELAISGSFLLSKPPSFPSNATFRATPRSTAPFR